MTTRDNQFPSMTSGQSDWDTDIQALISTLERGYHVTVQAGTAISTGQVLWVNSGEFAFPFDPNSVSIFPEAFAFTAASSGDSIRVLATGAVRSLVPAAVPGVLLYVSATTPGLIVTTPGSRPIGFGLKDSGIMFRPSFVRQALNTLFDVNVQSIYDGGFLQWNAATSKWIVTSAAGGTSTASWPAMNTSSLAISAVVGSTHVFTLSPGVWGWNREVVVSGNSADLVTLKFYSKADLTGRMYETKSGGVSVVGSFQDRAGFPFENTDTSTGSYLYGTISINSGAAVGSDTLTIKTKWDRFG